MTIVTTGYSESSNQPLNHARILFAPITGTVVGDGTNPAYAANDYTSQRWLLAPGSNQWTLQSSADANIDCIFIAAHNLAGKTVTVSTSDTIGGTHVDRVTIPVPDNSTIAALFNGLAATDDLHTESNDDLTTENGVTLATEEFSGPYGVREVRLTVNSGAGVAIGIIRAGQALQMPIPIYGGHRPLNLNRITEAQQQFSETGQWLGRIIKRRAVATTYAWEYLTPEFYETQFEPFAQSLPLQPFCIAGNPAKITADVGYVWTDRDVEPVIMGIRSYRSVSLSVTGYY